MLAKIKNLFTTQKEKTKQSVNARFDAAQTNRDNYRHWLAADSLSADAEANPEVRKTLRERSRYEIANNSYAKGLVQMLANDCIGTGPRLQMLSTDDELNDKIEMDFMAWASAVRLPAKLRTMRMARCQDGEAFAVLNTNPRIANNIKLDLSVIEADRVAGEINYDPNTKTYSADGISFDDWANPISYRVLKYHPGDDTFAGNNDDAVSVPSENMVHIFRQDRPGLHRGVPELTAALPLFAQLRRYNLAVLSAAEAAADFAAILYTDSPPDGESDLVEPMDSIPLERNMMLTVPAGWKLGQLDPKQPTSNHAEFVKVILSEIARCICSTYGTVAGDFSGFNYASGRLDNQLYQKAIIVDRSFWEADVLNRIFDAWLREYRIHNRLGSEITASHTWFWDGFLHVDPGKEATAQERRIRNHTTTLAEEYAKKGKDWRGEVLQIAKERRFKKAQGIPVEEYSEDLRRNIIVENEDDDDEEEVVVKKEKK